MFKKRHLALVVGAILATPTVQAESTKADETMIVEGREFGYKADANRTAMRMEMSLLDTPGQVAVLDEELINEQRASLLSEVLKNDASVSAGVPPVTASVSSCGVLSWAVRQASCGMGNNTGLTIVNRLSCWKLSKF